MPKPDMPREADDSEYVVPGTMWENDVAVNPPLSTMEAVIDSPVHGHSTSEDGVDSVMNDDSRVYRFVQLRPHGVHPDRRCLCSVPYRVPTQALLTAQRPAKV